MLVADCIAFKYGTRSVLKEVSFTVNKGEICSLLGNNGAGKSTLLKCILGFLRPGRGRVFLDGKDLSSMNRTELARRMGYVPQMDMIPARLTVFDTILMGRRPHIIWEARPRDLEVVGSVIETLGLQELSLRYLDELSGGELQKVAIARALAQEPEILLLDEPTSNLDPKNEVEVMEIVKYAVEERGMAALIAIHDVNLALRFSDRFVLLKDGCVLASGGPEVIVPTSLKEVYGTDFDIGYSKSMKVVVPLSKKWEDRKELISGGKSYGQG